ncbi:hypothetical protein DL98DRAFT_461194 [Cadophora sp. DSE1049]|nr:hypothetical protein DL98DRAFT_461194 [Cadophora sp. DSE1049]
MNLAHVVGSQGRRGRLPAWEGFSKPPEALKSFRPLPGPDGRFHCPSCPKTYQNARHMKRHVLRHTGSRPYPCGLCGDRFGRSDILKRHYKKCAKRRGIIAGPDDHLLPRKQLGSLSNPALQKGSQLTAPGPAHGQMGHSMSSTLTAY